MLYYKFLTAIYVLITKAPFFKEEIDFLCSDFVVGLEIVANNCLKAFKVFIGPENC